MRNNNQWTESRYRSFIISALRAASRRWPVKWAVLKDAAVGKQKNISTGKLAEHYKCASCGNIFPAKEVVVDHIDPVVDPKKGFVSWDDYIERMFCEAEGLQVLCKPCHKVKTDEERKSRKSLKA
jgi:5-methylcytosine-specific restriction endonuclease McrA